MSEFMDFNPGSVPVQERGIQVHNMPETTYVPVQEQPKEPESVKAYTLRTLCAKDIFPACQIVKKIGLAQFKDVLSKDEIKSIVKAANAENGGGTSDDSAVQDGAVASIGLSVVMSIVTVIINNIGQCEDDIYGFLSGLSGLDNTAIANLPIDVFAEMIVDVFQKPEFENFIKVVSRLLK